MTKPAIVFIDDFLNSGGQISSIMESWHSGDLKVPSGAGIDDTLSFNKRGHLSLSDLELLKKCELYFLFYYGMARGIEKADQKLKSLGFVGKFYEAVSKNPYILHELENIKLDFKQDAGLPLDITLFNVLPGPVLDLDLEKWKDATSLYTDLFNPDILDFTGIGDRGTTWVKELNPEIYSGINSYMEYRLKGDVFPVKIKSIHMTTFGNLVSFAGVRFQFKSDKITLKNAIDINFHFPINKASNNKTGLFFKNAATPVSFGSFFPIFPNYFKPRIC